MYDMSSGEMLIYVGIAIMVVVIVLTIICISIFRITGRKLKRQLEEEYGEPQR